MLAEHIYTTLEDDTKRFLSIFELGLMRDCCVFEQKGERGMQLRNNMLKGEV